jgi:hypothetical protein
MRFALAATTLAAIAAVPFAIAVADARMSGAEFLTSVACVAYADAAGASDLSGVKNDLNWEAHRQPDPVVLEALATARQAAAAARDGADRPVGCGVNEVEA